MAQTGSFTATGQLSPVFTPMRGGIEVGITIGGGTNSLTLEQNIGGTWYTVGSAKTATGRTHLTAGSDYVVGLPMRINGGTFDTGPITYQIDGDLIGDFSQAQLGAVAADSWQLEDGEAWLLEDGTYWLLEAA
jgi:hypothetical protein